MNHNEILEQTGYSYSGMIDYLQAEEDGEAKLALAAHRRYVETKKELETSREALTKAESRHASSVGFIIKLMKEVIQEKKITFIDGDKVVIAKVIDDELHHECHKINLPQTNHEL